MRSRIDLMADFFRDEAIAMAICWMFMVVKHLSSNNIYSYIGVIIFIVFTVLNIIDIRKIFIRNTLRFAKVHKWGRIPSKRDEDGGYDIYPCFDEPYKKIGKNETVMVGTGIASSFSSDWVAILKERGSTGSKGIGQRCGVIDSGYRNEWFVPLTNHTDKDIYITKAYYLNELADKLGDDEYTIYPYEKAICQMLIIPNSHGKVEEVPYDVLLEDDSERGMGALGSSGK